MAKDLIRISLKAYDHKLLDKSAEKILCQLREQYILY